MPQLGGDWRVHVKTLNQGDAMLLGDLDVGFVLVSQNLLIHTLLLVS